jgi:hypothetical protein
MVENIGAAFLESVVKVIEWSSLVSYFFYVFTTANVPLISRRVKKLMSSGDAVIGGEVDDDENYIAPTVLANVSPSDPVMQEEVLHGHTGFPWQKLNPRAYDSATCKPPTSGSNGLTYKIQLLFH